MQQTKQHIDLMKTIQEEWMITTDHPIKMYMQIWTRLCELVRSWYLESTILENGRAIYTLTQRGIDWKGEQLVMYYKKVSPDKKPRKSKEESLVKNECIWLNTEIYRNNHTAFDKRTELINTNNWTPKHSLREHIKSLLF